jgi:DNA-binding Lrp family transcriptional regulator
MGTRVMAKSKIILTERDVKILKLLKEFGVVSTDQLGRFIFNGVNRTTVLRRLRLLEDSHYIRKRGTLPNATAVWVIEPDGTKILSGVSERDIYPIHQLPHEMTLNEVRWKMYELDLVKSWMTERDLRKQIAKEYTYKRRTGWIVPDALVSFQNVKMENFHARIEVELTLKSDQKYEQLVKKYYDWYDKKHVFTWYVVKSAKMGIRILTLAQKYGALGAEKHFGFTVIDEFLKNPWRTNIQMWSKQIPMSEFLNAKDPIPAAQGDAQDLSRKMDQKNEDVAA